MHSPDINAAMNRDILCRYNGNNITVPHGMFGRWGGVSAGSFDSLNLSYSVGDRKTSVSENRRLLKQSLDLSLLVSSHQIHGDRVAVVTGLSKDTELEGYDALITKQPDIGLLIQQADCQAVLLHDPDKGAIAAIHNGWRGSTLNIIGQTIESMRENFGTDPGHIQAVISPSLGPCCSEFINFHQELPPQFLQFQTMGNHFDFWAISRWQLEQTGIPRKNIEVTEICTVCDHNFFSYRRAKKKGTGKTGRNGSIIALP